MAASLCRSGFSVATADMFADLDTCQVAQASRLRRYPWAALSWLHESEVDAWCYTGGMENYPRLIQRMASERPLLGNSSETLRKVRDPFRLAHLAKEHGFLFPETRRSLAASSGDRWLVKPFRSAGGLQIRRCRDEPFVGQHAYVQREMEGTPMSLAVLSTSRQWTIMGVSQLLVGTKYGAPGEFIFAGAITTSLEEMGCGDELKEIIAAIHNDANLVGLWGVDFLLADRPIVLEVNPRWTATMPLYERVDDASLMSYHMAACREQTLIERSVKSMRVSGVAILYSAREFILDEARLAQLSNVFDLSREASLAKPEIADIPVLGTRIEVGHPICSVYADGGTSHEVEQRLQERIARTCAVLGQDVSWGRERHFPE
ncbi:hypothetical protein C5Y97_16915 [Blastopirellula marina]|uniref:ATP-grasp domain-containing protein n=1 Tax=Blastopirellula marina TaxID=124 RepID=A0A2S8FP05_9BACT|nr:hypothetical protein C5Y98_16905 [Blastopirellula marina]PTL43688.1 hypothetical protein C5Y97_16915 [Blastopirellula marina]